jgi:hypothetical protein
MNEENLFCPDRVAGSTKRSDVQTRGIGRTKSRVALHRWVVSLQLTLVRNTESHDDPSY